MGVPRSPHLIASVAVVVAVQVVDVAADHLDHPVDVGRTVAAAAAAVHVAVDGHAPAAVVGVASGIAPGSDDRHPGDRLPGDHRPDQLPAGLHAVGLRDLVRQGPHSGDAAHPGLRRTLRQGGVLDRAGPEGNPLRLLRRAFPHVGRFARRGGRRTRRRRHDGCTCGGWRRRAGIGRLLDLRRAVRRADERESGESAAAQQDDKAENRPRPAQRTQPGPQAPERIRRLRPGLRPGRRWRLVGHRLTLSDRYVTGIT